MSTDQDENGAPDERAPLEHRVGPAPEGDPAFRPYHHPAAGRGAARHAGGADDGAGAFGDGRSGDGAREPESVMARALREVAGRTDAAGTPAGRLRTEAGQRARGRSGRPRARLSRGGRQATAVLPASSCLRTVQCSESSTTSATIVSPGSASPPRRRVATRLSSSVWIVRRNGRAPKAGW